MVWSTIESSLESVPTPNIVNIGVFKNSLFDVLLQVDGRLLDEGQDCCSFGTGCIIYGCTVSERNGLITIKSSGGVRAGGSREGWKRNTTNSYIRIFLRNPYRTKEFFYIIDSKIVLTSGTD